LALIQPILELLITSPLIVEPATKLVRKVFMVHLLILEGVPKIFTSRTSPNREV